MYTDIKIFLNLKIIYRKQKENVELNFEFTRLETSALFRPPCKWHFIHKFGNH